MQGFSLVLVGETVTSEHNQGTFSLDMARVGVFERKPLLAHFDGDGEALFDWSERTTDNKSSAWGGIICHKKSGLEALYVNIGSDCKCLVQLLRSGKRAVGVRVVPKVAPERSSDRLGSRHWTWVELKCGGVGNPLSFCDDRDYDPDFDLLLDNVRFEVSSIDENGCLDPKTIDLDTSVSHYGRRYKGVAKVSVFYERAGEACRIRLPKTYSIPKLSSKATPRRIAEAVFDIFKHARQVV